MSKIRLVIVEDDDSIRNSMRIFLSKSNDFEVVCTYALAEDFVRDFQELDMEVVLMDISLPGMNGIECVEKLKPLRPEIQYLMCTIHEDQERTFGALCAGASGYILKSTTPAGLMDAILEISQGGSPMSAQIARYVIKYFQGQNKKPEILEMFTAREQELLQALSRGYQYKEIADKLFISIDTVRSYVRKIYEKLHVHTRAEALNKIYPRNNQ